MSQRKHTVICSLVASILIVIPIMAFIYGIPVLIIYDLFSQGAATFTGAIINLLLLLFIVGEQIYFYKKDDNG